MNSENASLLEQVRRELAPDGLIMRFLPLWVALALVMGPTYYGIIVSSLSPTGQGHEPIVMGILIWLFWSRKAELASGAGASGRWVAWLIGAAGVLLYVVGRSQAISTIEVPGHILIATALVLHFTGWKGMRAVWFPLLFWLVLVPLPGVLTDPLTRSLKMLVSQMAETILYALGYPIARSGVILNIGQYQLLVADACSGLNSIFVLSAMGMLYLYLAGHRNVMRNIVMLLLILPLAVVANWIRVMALILITYYLGDEAGQGFVHEFAGLVLFAVALLLFFTSDMLLGRVMKERKHGD
ncbi:exosortase B [Paludibacterium paludis]|uniref:Exosortase n=1 Tax=Paludibacterium paludis TaxID=1225769 RepID=A0A918P397_9NEIS|nr:exosortase B [Paludibacterium paludis]GGY15663.1 exosortase [Paludibacterium paludis]